MLENQSINQSELVKVAKTTARTTIGRSNKKDTFHFFVIIYQNKTIYLLRSQNPKEIGVGVEKATCNSLYTFSLFLTITRWHGSGKVL